MSDISDDVDGGSEMDADENGIEMDFDENGNEMDFGEGEDGNETDAPLVPFIPERQKNQVAPGHIRSITLQNIMCHKNFHIDFSPRINFVVGANGSGKSAILSGIVLGLGGRSSNTNRGSNMASFITNGEKKGRIVITLANSENLDGSKGKYSYYYDRYGGSIIIERTLSTNGQSNYKIKSVSGRVISEKKEELDNILRHFSVNIDNPVCVLTQETSKYFLNKSSAEDKFRFFVRCTGIEDSRMYLEESAAKIRKSKGDIPEKEKIINFKKNKMDDYLKRIQIFNIFRDKMNIMKRLNREWLWAEFQNERNKLEADRKKLIKHNEEFMKCESEMKDIERKISDIKAKKDVLINKLQNISEDSKMAKKELDEAEEKARNARKELSEKESILREKKNALIHHIRDIDIIKSTVYGIERDSEESEGTDLETRIQNLTDEIKKLQENANELRTSEREFRENGEELQQKYNQCRDEERKIASQITGIQMDLDRLKRSQRDPLSRYGTKYPELNLKIAALHKQGKFKKLPLGPIGEYIRLEDHSVALAVECFLKKFLFSYVVDNRYDSEILKNLIQKTFNGQNEPQIIVQRFTPLHDVSRKEAISQNFQNFLNLLNIDSKYSPVANCLIDHHHIEQVLYIPDFDEAQSILLRKESVPKNCSMAYTKNGDLMFPTSQHSGYKCYPNKTIRYPRLLVQDHSSKEQHEKSIQELKERQNKCHEIGKKTYEKMEENKKNIAEILAKMNKCQMEKISLDRKLIELKGLASSKPTESLKDEIQQKENEREEMQKELDQINLERNKLSERYMLFENEADAKSKAFQDIINSKEPMKKELEQINNVLRECEKNFICVQRHQEGLANVKIKLENEIKAFEEHLKEKESENLKITGEPIQTTKTLAQIKAEIERVEQVIQENKDTVDSESICQLRELYDNLKQEVNIAVSNLKTFKKDLKLQEELQVEREKGFIGMREHTVEMVNYFFHYFLKQKDMKGNIHVNFFDQSHVKSGSNKRANTLEIEVEPTDTHGNISQSYSGSSTKSLSGGERSFSTVAFIMALWQICHSPFKILDEVDVFMDMVTRKLSLDALVAFASTHDGQFIFFSPLQLQQFSDLDIKIFQMPEPIRNTN